MARVNREFVMLAEKFSSAERTNIGQWYWSEKLDGMRALWIPATRGLPVDKIEFANKDKKQNRLTWQGKIATGLWSRYANVINAPNSFLDQLPEYCLDGELYLGRGRFQELIGYAKKDYPIKSEWDQIQYYIIDAPSYKQVFCLGRVNGINYKNVFTGNPYFKGKELIDSSFFIARYRKLKEQEYGSQIKLLEQSILPVSDVAARDYLTVKLLEISKAQGEGIIVRDSMSEWEPIRSKRMLKLKPILDDEATVIDYTDGKGRLENLMGAILVRWKGKEFKLSGWTDYERQHFKELFPIGSTVTFVYRELTDDGCPKEARYLRKRVIE